MNFKKIKPALYDLIKVSGSNILQMVSGVLVGLLLPKIIGVSDYGYYKTFTLYSSYVGLLHFGFSDGIYLKYGGEKYEKLNKEKFRFYSASMIFMEVVISLIILAFSISFLRTEYKFIFICIAIYLVANNVTSYFQMISQITKRFTELSLRNVIQSFFISVSIVVLWIIRESLKVNISYRIYTVIYVSIYTILATWYLLTYKEIVFGSKKNSSSLTEFFSLIQMGFPLMLSNLCLTLLITIDSQFVNILFDTDTYAIYAFAYNLLALITTALNAISTVLYPVMRRARGRAVKKSYPVLNMLIMVLVAFCIAVFFPLSWFVNFFLPKYTQSIAIFRVILPGLIFSSATTLVIHNYYKVEGKTFTFFVQSLGVLAIACLSNTVAYALWHTPQSISWASVFVMLLWYLIADKYISKEYDANTTKNLIFSLVVTVTFYMISLVQNIIIGFVLYLIVLVIVIMLFYKNTILDMISEVD